MRSLLALLAFSPLVLAAPLQAREVVYETVVEEITIVSGPGDYVSMVPPAAVPRGIARYGPFRVIDAKRAALVDVTSDGSPAAFAAMLRDYPGIATLEMIECPGTENDRANLQLGRMIRAAGIETHVPRGGSVRSGAVELFLAGAARRIDDGAEFAVHSWIDDTGHQAGDYGANSPENRKYLNYYREMGMGEPQATAFYAMTNSVPFESARWLSAGEMRHWIAAPAPVRPALPVPTLAAADVLSPDANLPRPLAVLAFAVTATPQVAYSELAYLDLSAALH